MLRKRLLGSVLLCAGMALSAATIGTPALGQTPSNSPADREMADRYYRAAQNGDDVAQFYLGSLYAQGVGRPQSDTESFRWIEQAAMRGNAQAMLVTAGLAALGKGTQKDYVVSYKWAFLVAEGSQQFDMKNGGRQLISLLEPRMSPDQIQGAKTMAYQFRAITVPVTARPASAAPAPPSVPPPSSVPPTIVAPAPAPPTLQPTAPSAGPQPAPRAPGPAVSESTSSPSSPSQSPIAVEAQKHMSKENVDKMMKNIPPQFRKRFGL